MGLKGEEEVRREEDGREEVERASGAGMEREAAGVMAMGVMAMEETEVVEVEVEEGSLNERLRGLAASIPKILSIFARSSAEFGS